MVKKMKPVVEKYGISALVRKVEELAVEGREELERFVADVKDEPPPRRGFYIDF